MFSPSEILYLVLSFCVLWLTAALFWFVWQAAQILRNVNSAVDEARERIEKIEQAITGIRSRFDSMTAPASLLFEGAKKLIEYAVDKRRDRKD